MKLDIMPPRNPVIIDIGSFASWVLSVAWSFVFWAMSDGSSMRSISDSQRNSGKFRFSAAATS